MKNKKIATEQLSLFDYISSSKSITHNERDIVELLKQIKEYIKSGVLNESNTYFNIAYKREIKILQNDDGVYNLKFAQSSDSERILSVYENNPNCTPLELLGASAKKGAINSIRNYIKDNPEAAPKQILEHYSIFDYPTYRWVHAQSKSLQEIETVKQLIIDWVEIKEKLQLDLSEGRFTFMRVNKRGKTEDETNVIPQCFDGLCLESNMMKILQDARIAA